MDKEYLFSINVNNEPLDELAQLKAVNDKLFASGWWSTAEELSRVVRELERDIISAEAAKTAESKRVFKSFWDSVLIDQS